MYSIKEVRTKDISPLLAEIPDAPKVLRIQGTFPTTEDMKYLTVVGSRKYSDYGKAVCEQLISGLSGYPITIISGLALGIDSIAHRSAISAGLQTMAVPGSGLSDAVLYPASHRSLRDTILKSDGCLLSEFEDDFKATPWSFPKRNRIMAGLSHAVLIIEAEIKSGTLITSKYATEYNRDVFTVPHSIFSKTGEGPHMLIRLGATPITTSEDILSALGFKEKQTEEQVRDYSTCSDDELMIIELLKEPMSKDEIIYHIDKPVHVIQTLLSIMELKGIIKEEMSEIRLI